MVPLIKKALLAFALTLLYLAGFAAGSFLRPFGRVQTLGAHGLAIRLFVWDGVLVLLALYGLTLLIELLGKRLRDLALWTTGSLFVAGLLGYLLRFGFLTREF